MEYFLAGALIFISGIFKAYTDLISEEKLAYRGEWWSKINGSRLKYKNKDPLQGAKFVGSTTMFVWLTDGWHLFQMLYLSCLDLAISLMTTSDWYVIVVFFSIKLLRGSIFEVVRKKLQEQKL